MQRETAVRKDELTYEQQEALRFLLHAPGACLPARGPNALRETIDALPWGLVESRRSSIGELDEKVHYTLTFSGVDIARLFSGIRTYPVVVDIDGDHIILNTFGLSEEEARASAIHFANSAHGFTRRTRPVTFVRVGEGHACSDYELHRSSHRAPTVST